MNNYQELLQVWIVVRKKNFVFKKLRKSKVGHKFGVVLSLVTLFCRKLNTKKEKFKTATYLDAHFSFFRLLVPIIFSYLIFQQYICKCKSEIFFYQPLSVMWCYNLDHLWGSEPKTRLFPYNSNLVDLTSSSYPYRKNQRVCC